MKRRVGAILVRNRRILSTGYACANFHKDVRLSPGPPTSDTMAHPGISQIAMREVVPAVMAVAIQ